MSTYFVIFGAAVWADGTPSDTLRWRVEGALAAAREVHDARFLPTGGPTADGVVEAAVMIRLLCEAGVPPGAILAEDRARDTLDSAFYCDALLRRAGDAGDVVACSSQYHLPRCATLLRLSGWPVRMAEMPSDIGRVPLRTLLVYWLKEAIILPIDAVLVLIRRRRCLSRP